MEEKKKAFYVHADKITQELAKVHQNQIMLNKVASTIKELVPLSWGLVQAFCAGKTEEVTEKYIDIETKKVQKMIDEFGQNIVTEGAFKLLEEKVLGFQQKLNNCQRPHADYMKYFKLDFTGEVIRNEKYPDSYFQELHSVYLTPAQTEIMKKHEKVTDLLNELIQSFENEVVAFDSLFIKDLESGKLYINGNYYLNNNIE